MTISTTTNRVTYTGNGATTAFSFPYAFFAQADLVVIETIIATGVQTVKALTTDYTISGSVDALGHYSSGGTLTAVAAPASTKTWTIYRDVEAVQETDLVENDPMPAESLEAALDYQTMLNQRTRDIAARSLQQPEGDSATIDRLPAKVDRASTYLAFDADGDPIAGTDPTGYPASSFMATVLDDTTAALARATLGAVGVGENIAFPATQVPSGDANTLDDYEEGNWTPSIGGSATYTTAVGKYTKIGRVVYIHCLLIINAIGSGSVDTISGLPFTAAAGADSTVTVGDFASLATNVAFLAGRINAGAATITLRNTTAAAASSTSSTLFGNGAGVTLSGFYFV